MRRDRDRDGRVDARQLLDCDRVRERVGAAAAVLLGDGHPHQPELGQLGDELVRKALRPVELLRDRRHALERELPDGVAQELVLRLQVEVHAVGRRRGPSSTCISLRDGTEEAVRTRRIRLRILTVFVRTLEYREAMETVESLSEEIGRIVAERQGLRAAGADHDALEENRRRLAAAQARLSELLIERYLPHAESA